MDLQAAYAIAYNFPGALYILGRASWVSVRSHCAVLSRYSCSTHA